MHWPRLKALTIIRRGGAKGACFSPAPLQILVQCDEAEAFYRLPGGSVEFGETAAEALVREMREEFDVAVAAGPLAAVVETPVAEGGPHGHEVHLVHWCQAADVNDLPDVLPHRENRSKAVWRTLAQLRERPLYPTGILALLEKDDPTAPVVHLVTRA